MIRVIKFLLPFLFLFVLWEVLCALAVIDVTFFPAPHKIIAHTFDRLFSSDLDLFFNMLSSLRRLLIAAIFAVPLAILTALLVFSSRLVRGLVGPLVAAFFPLPKIAIYPIVLLIFGIGDVSQIIVIGLAIFFLVNVNTLMGMRHLESLGYLNVVKVYKLKTLIIFSKILIPGSWSEILEGIKLGLVHGLVMMVASEFTVSRNGLGLIMWNAWDHFKILDVYSCLLIITIIGLFFFYSIDLLKLYLAKKYYG